MKNKVLPQLKIISFVLFIFVCIWIYFFKCNLNRDLYFFFAKSQINWNPFSEIIQSDGSFSWGNFALIILNIVGFVFFGYLAAGIFEKHYFVFGILLSLVLTLTIETLQYAFRFGGAALGDVIFNLLGGIIGVVLYHFTNKKVKPIIQNIYYIVTIGVSVVCIVLGIIFTAMKWPEYIYFC